jgi:hypothetical protein
MLKCAGVNDPANALITGEQAMKRFEGLAKKIKKMSTAQVVGLAAGISAGVFIVWMTLTTLVWGILQLAGVRFSLWEMLEAVSTAAAVAQVFGGGVVALVQLTESVDNRNLGIYNDVFEKMMSDENIEARRWIYQQLPPFTPQGMSALSADDRQAVKRVLNSFDHLGFLVQQDWVTAEPVVHWVSPMVVKAWDKLGPYVDHETQRRREPDYYEAARMLAKVCQEWRRTHIPETEIVWAKDSL